MERGHLCCLLVAAPVERIDLWVVDLDRWAGTPPDLDGLTGEDRTQAARLRDPVVAHRFLARRSVTRSLLADVLGIDGHRLEIGRHCPSCGGSDHGRPFVRNAGIEFSVSSSGPIAAIAVSDQPVGVDIEQPRSGIIPVPNALSERERRARRLAGRTSRGRGVPPAVDGQGGRAESQWSGPR